LIIFDGCNNQKKYVTNFIDDFILRLFRRIEFDINAVGHEFQLKMKKRECFQE